MPRATKPALPLPSLCPYIGRENDEPRDTSMRLILMRTSALLLALFLTTTDSPARSEAGFVSLFDGRSLNGWTLVGQKGDGYLVKDGLIVCSKGGGGNLLTEKEYGDFILRLEYRTEPGGNNGIGIRAPLTDKQVAYHGMEIQILDDDHPKYASLKPWQFCGSVYGIFPARRGATKPAEKWNEMEITCQGRQIKVELNGRVIINASLNDVTDHEVLATHPGMLRERGRIGLLGHNDYVEFRNLRLKELPRALTDNLPPPGFQALFNGRDLSGWQGLVDSPYDNPYKRLELPIEKVAELQVEANVRMRKNWQVANGMISYLGNGFDNLQTAWDYENFELLVDWRIEPNSDSGLYLRGTPQVQIWDPWNLSPQTRVGSGGLFNNKVHRSTPLVRADRFQGEWNRFRILMLGERVTIYLNEELVVYDGKAGTVLENFWDREQPVIPRGPIELQAHRDPVQFKNIFLRELP
jgi:hypothetical protein